MQPKQALDPGDNDTVLFQQKYKSAEKTVAMRSAWLLAAAFCLLGTEVFGKHDPEAMNSLREDEGLGDSRFIPNPYYGGKPLFTPEQLDAMAAKKEREAAEREKKRLAFRKGL